MNRDLAGAMRAAREEESREVGAGEQQDAERRTDQRHDQPLRPLRHFTAQWYHERPRPAVAQVVLLLNADGDRVEVEPCLVWRDALSQSCQAEHVPVAS